jgi:hypothetical protein
MAIVGFAIVVLLDYWAARQQPAEG